MLCILLTLGISACGKKENINEKKEISEYAFLATDVRNHSIVVFDLALTEGNFQNLANGDQCVVWEWDEDDVSDGVDRRGGGFDAAKLRYSPYYGKDVVIACSSGGWAGVIDYETQAVLWEWCPGRGNFHSIEMMPNGDIVVAGAGGDGRIYYIPVASGVTEPSHSIGSPSGHGVVYDPETEWLWILDYDEIYACTVSGYGTAEAELERVKGTNIFLGSEKDGHVLSPVFGEPGKFWVAISARVYLFDAKEKSLTEAPDYYNDKLVKGMAYLPNQTMVMTVAQTGNATFDWSCGEIRIVAMESSDSNNQEFVAVDTNVAFDDREFYKVYPFTKDYH